MEGQGRGAASRTYGGREARDLIVMAGLAPSPDKVLSTL